jgi:hypothetical protein
MNRGKNRQQNHNEKAAFEIQRLRKIVSFRRNAMEARLGSERNEGMKK